MNKWTGFFLAAGAVLIIGFALLRKVFWNRILEQISAEEFKKDEASINGPLGNLCLSRMNQTTLFLSCLMGEGDSKRIRHLINQLPKLTDQQREQILARAFAWFVSTKDRQGAVEAMNLSNHQKEDKQMQIDILLDGRTNHIEKLCSRMKDLPDAPAKGIMAYLVGVQYDLLDQKDKAREYYEITRRCCGKNVFAQL